MLKLSMVEMARLIKERKISSVEATKLCLDQISKTTEYNALTCVCAERALACAADIDARLARGEDIGELGGVPIIIKDNINVEGLKTTCASKALENFEAVDNATVTSKVLAVGAVIVGKANMDEFAMGSSNETSYFGPVKNPAAPDCIPGGSSGGSAAAMAAHMAYAALGSDTGGSIRQPASLCGVVGVKPTYGTVSRSGVVAFASSLDQVGPITKTVEDAALLLRVISGYDPMEETSIKKSAYPTYKIDPDYNVKGLRIGLPKELLDGLTHKDVKDNFATVLDVYKRNGAELVEVSMDPLKYALSVYFVLTCSEAASNLARFDGIKYGHRSSDFDGVAELYFKSRAEGFGLGVKRRIMMGNYMLNSSNYEQYYYKARQLQTLIRHSYADAYAKCDLILTPTTPTPTVKFGEKSEDMTYGFPSDIFTVAVNVSGNTAISLPSGFSSEGRPLGIQLVAPSLGEDLMLNAAYFYQENR